MARKITPERRERRKQLLALLQDAGINDVEGVQDLLRKWSVPSSRTGWRASWMKSSVTYNLWNVCLKSFTEDRQAKEKGVKWRLRCALKYVRGLKLN